jgi:hypothetical protein
MAAAKSTLAARIDSAICKVILEEAVEDVGVVVEGLVGEFLDPADEAVPVDVCQSIPPRRGWGPWLVRGLLSGDPAPVSHTARLLRYEREPHLPEPVSAPAAEALELDVYLVADRHAGRPHVPGLPSTSARDRPAIALASGFLERNQVRPMRAAVASRRSSWRARRTWRARRSASAAAISSVWRAATSSAVIRLVSIGGSLGRIAAIDTRGSGGGCHPCGPPV